MLGKAKSLDDLGMRLGADLTAAEVRYLMTQEWAQSADDVLWRRSKLGLRFSDAQRADLDRFMARDKGYRGRLRALFVNASAHHIGPRFCKRFSPRRTDR